MCWQIRNLSVKYAMISVKYAMILLGYHFRMRKTSFSKIITPKHVNFSISGSGEGCQNFMNDIPLGKPQPTPNFDISTLHRVHSHLPTST